MVSDEDLQEIDEIRLEHVAKACDQHLQDLFRVTAHRLSEPMSPAIRGSLHGRSRHWFPRGIKTAKS